LFTLPLVIMISLWPVGWMYSHPVCCSEWTWRCVQNTAVSRWLWQRYTRRCKTFDGELLTSLQ
jgi:hypothetical protein